MAGMLSDNQWTVRLLAATTLTPLKQHTIYGVPTFEGIKGEEFVIEVNVPVHLHASLLAMDGPGTNINISVALDGMSLGYSWNLDGKSTHQFDYIITNGNKVALKMIEPEAVDYVDEIQEKRNVEANKTSEVGLIVITVRTTRSLQVPVACSSTVGSAKPKVQETKKFFNQPSLGVGAGRVLGVDATSYTQVQNVRLLGAKTVRIQTALVCDVLSRKELQEDIERRKAEKQAAGGGSDSDSAVAENPKRRKLAAAAAAAAAEPQITFIDLT